MATWRQYVEELEYGDVIVYPLVQEAKGLFEKHIRGKEKIFLRELRHVIVADQVAGNGAKVTAINDLHDLVEEYGPKAFVRLYGHVGQLRSAMKLAANALWIARKAALEAEIATTDAELEA